MFGTLFEELIGKSASEFESISDLEQAVEDANKIPLEVKTYDSNLVHERGCIFPHSKKDRDLNSEIDSYLSL